MLGACVFVFQFRHLLLRSIQDAAELIRKTQIDSCAVNFRTPLEFAGQALTQTSHWHTNLFEQRPRYSICLIEKHGKKMLISDLLVIGLRSEILRSLQCFLHFLHELVDANTFKIMNAPT